MSSPSLTSITSLSNYSSSSSFSEHSKSLPTYRTSQLLPMWPMSGNGLASGKTVESDMIGNNNSTSTNMGQPTKSSLVCQSLSWDSYPLRDLTCTGTEITFTEIEKFLRDDDTFTQACEPQHSRLAHMDNQPVLSSTPNQQMNKILIDRSNLVNINSLLQALSDFGLTPTASQLQLLRFKIPIQEEYCARFGDFVDCVKDVFNDQLGERYNNSKNNSNTLNNHVACTTICQNCINSKNQVSRLQVHLQHLKNRLIHAQQSCSNAEQKLAISGKDLQVQIECTRKLSEQMEFKAKSKPIADQEQAENELQIAEEKFKSLRHECNSNHTDHCHSKMVEDFTRKIRQLESTNLIYKDAITKMLYFLKGLCETLKHPSQIPNAKVGRSFSLYRNATVTNAGQSAIPRGAVLRAASVCTSVRPSNSKSSAPTSTDKGLDTRGNIQNRYASLILQSEELILSVQEVLKEICGSQDTDDESGDYMRRKSSITNKPLQNLPTSTIVTVMSMV